MALCKPLCVIPGEPDAPVFVLPRERLERQVNPGWLAFLHERRAASRVAEEQQLGGTQMQASVERAFLVIDAGEHQQARRSRRGRETIDGLGHGKPALHSDQSVAHLRLLRSLPQPL
jgi:hypothetical protein